MSTTPRVGNKPHFWRRATSVEVADGLLRHTFTLYPAGDQAHTDALKRILSAYLFQ